MSFLSNLFGGLFSSDPGSDGTISLVDLDRLVVRLSKGEMPEGFFGLISQETGCVYFVVKDGSFFLDIEIFNETDEPFAQKLEIWATGLGKEVVETTYGNPDEMGNENAKVVRVETGDTPDSLHKDGVSYLKNSYQVSDDHIFDVVP